MDSPLLLIVGGESDPNTQRVVDQAHLRDRPYLFWDTDAEGARQIAWDFDSPALDLGDRSIEPTAIYLRYNVFEGDPAANMAAFDTVQSYALAWPHLRILNRNTLTDANNKCKNLRTAKQVGFEIPETLVMADLTPLRTIPDPDSRAMKPLSGGAHTMKISDVHQDPEKLATLGPQFVQNRLEGENLRVFCIAGKLSCFHLQTTKLDYREDDEVEVVQTDVPESVVEPTHRLVSEIGFDYSALDFRCRSGMDEPVFLEVNSFPMFIRFDDAGKNCLADAIIDFLLPESS